MSSRRPTSPRTRSRAVGATGSARSTCSGRRGPAQAAFTNKELKELGELPDVDVIVVTRPTSNSTRSSAAYVAGTPNRTRDRNLEILAGFAAGPPTGASKRIVLHFLVSPVAIIGTERVEALTIVHNELYESEDGSIRPRPTERTTTLPVRLVFRAIGYQGVPLPGIPFDAMRGVIPNEAGRIIDPRTGAQVRGEYVVGWIKRGPQGIIGTNKPDSQETVDSLLADLARAISTRTRSPPATCSSACCGAAQRFRLLRGLAADRPAGAGARGRQGRTRVKFSKVEEMLHALQERKRLAAAEAAAERRLLGGGLQQVVDRVAPGGDAAGARMAASSSSGWRAGRGPPPRRARCSRP